MEDAIRIVSKSTFTASGKSVVGCCKNSIPHRFAESNVGCLSARKNLNRNNPGICNINYLNRKVVDIAKGCSIVNHHRHSQKSEEVFNRCHCISLYGVIITRLNN